MSPGNQVHDFNPGVNPFPSSHTDPNGLFWLVPVPASALKVNLDAGRAELAVKNLAISDYTNITNALTSDPPPIPEIPSTVSFEVEWAGVITRTHRNNPTEGFAGSFVETGATIRWSAMQTASPFFSFVADAPHVSPQTTVFAEIGDEGNGVFYPPG